MDVARAAQALAPRVAPSFLKTFWSFKNWELRSVWNLVLEIRDLNEFIFEKEDL